MDINQTISELEMVGLKCTILDNGNIKAQFTKTTINDFETAAKLGAISKNQDFGIEVFLDGTFASMAQITTLDAQNKKP